MSSMSTTSLVLFVLGYGFVLWPVIKVYSSFNWHNRGVGERKGKAEYSRIQREEPASENAKLSESEFVDTFVSSKPSIFLYLPMAAACIIIPMAFAFYEASQNLSRVSHGLF